MSHRLVRLIAIGLVSLGLSVGAAHARVEQFCGFDTQFKDFIIIHAVIEEASRLVIPGQWVQIVPHEYTLLGPGTIIRDPLLVVSQEFEGGFTVVNPSPAFLANPSCTVVPTLTIEDPTLPLLTGSALMTCFGGPVGTFQVTLGLRMTTCDEPTFPVGGVEAQAAAARRPAGLGPNEYVAP